MRHVPLHRWMNWRTPQMNFPVRVRATMNLQPESDPEPQPTLPGDRPDLRAEAPGPDGIRWGLVEHVRRLIQMGRYDTPERWAAAEAKVRERMSDS